MARVEVYDTCVWIPVLNTADPQTIRQVLSASSVLLSSVVVSELRAGTRSEEDSEMINEIVATMKRYKRLLTPTHEDWESAATLIARQSRLKGKMELWDHMGDALITVSTARIRGAVVTRNTSDFDTWAGLARASGLDIIVRRFEP